MDDDTKETPFEEMTDAIHTLAQPLTALSFVLEMGVLADSPESWKSALEQARVETRRAIANLNDLREKAAKVAADAANRKKNYGSLPWKPQQ